jgi:adenine phosphoribosyltransferase
MEYYTIDLYGIKRTLPLVHVGKQSKLANFTLLGDIELVDVLADELTEKFRHYAFDYIVALEVKVVPLAHGIAKRLGHKRFIVCRKRVKPYMVEPVILKPYPNFPKHVQPIVINGPDAALLKGKRVIVIDDVVSTGMTMRLMHALMQKIGATVVASAAVLRQGEQFITIDPFIFVAELPVIKVEDHLVT